MRIQDDRTGEILANIHEHLIRSESTYLKGKVEEAKRHRICGTLITINVNLAFDCTRVYASHCYGAERLVPNTLNSDEDRLIALLHSFSSARKIGDSNFTSKLMKNLIEFMTLRLQGILDGDELIAGFVFAFPNGSKGRLLLIHWMVYSVQARVHCVEPSFEHIGDFDFVKSLAKESIRANMMDEAEKEEWMSRVFPANMTKAVALYSDE